MTNQEYLAERIQKLSAEEVYDLLYDIIINQGSRAGIAQWLTEESKEHNDSRHGHWIWCADVRCSRCNYKLESTGLPSICPHCGASMNEGVRTKGITYYTATDCPSKECKIKVTNNHFTSDDLVSVADFSGVCRFYIGWIVSEVENDRS